MWSIVKWYPGFNTITWMDDQSYSCIIMYRICKINSFSGTKLICPFPSIGKCDFFLNLKLKRNLLWFHCHSPFQVTLDTFCQNNLLFQRRRIMKEYYFILLNPKVFHYRPQSWKIIHLVLYVNPSVCLGLWDIRCAPLQWYSPRSLCVCQ